MIASAQWRRRLVTVCGVLVAACALVSRSTGIAASVEAAPDVNPDARGRPSPVVVKLYELKSPAAFDAADFFSLFEKERETLGADFVAREEFQFVPGNRRTFERKLQPDTRYIGIVAAFRDLERAQWRATVPIRVNRKTTLAIRLEADKVAVSSR